MMYYISIVLFVLGFLIYKKYINLSSSEKNNKDFSKNIAKTLYTIGFLLLCIQVISEINIQDERLNIFLNLLIFALLILIPIYFIINNNKNKSSLIKKIGFMFGLLILLFFTQFYLYFCMRQPRFEITSNQIIIHSFISPTTYSLNEIDSIKINSNKIDIKQKISGLDLGSFYRGQFYLNNTENICNLYINDNYKDKLFIYFKNNKVLIYNSPDQKELFLLYKKLK